MVIEIYFYKDIIQIYMIISDLQMAHKKISYITSLFFKNRMFGGMRIYTFGQFLR
jgi:hypothetical protein